MLRAGAYFPPSRNGRSWSPSAAAPGHQERLALVMGILYPLRCYTPSASLVPLREGQLWIQLLSNWGTIMRDATTPPRAGEVSVGRRGDIHRRNLHHTPSATLVPLKEGQLWIQLLLNWGTVMRNARRSCVKIHFSSADDADTQIFHLYIIPKGYYLSAQSA